MSDHDGNMTTGEVKRIAAGQFAELLRKSKGPAKKWWVPIAIAALSTMATIGQFAVASVSEKANTVEAETAKRAFAIEQGRDRRDEDIIRMMDAIEKQNEQIVLIRIENAKIIQTLDWLKRKATTTIKPAIVDPMNPPDVTIPDLASVKIEDIPVSEDRLKAYQESRKE